MNLGGLKLMVFVTTSYNFFTKLAICYRYRINFCKNTTVLHPFERKRFNFNFTVENHLSSKTTLKGIFIILVTIIPGL